MKLTLVHLKCVRKKKLDKNKSKKCQSNLVSEGELCWTTFCEDEELGLFCELGEATANGFTDDLIDSGPSIAILLHNESQLLITSVSLPLSSPISTCNG